jgi:mRNA interferase HigB
LSQDSSQARRKFQNLPDAPASEEVNRRRTTPVLRGGYRFGNLKAVRIISKAAITEFSKIHPDPLEPMLYWHSITKRAAWRHLADVRTDFPHADAVGTFTVFNISGNKYRLISVIKYQWQIVYIRHILTHADCDKGKWKL